MYIYQNIYIYTYPSTYMNIYVYVFIYAYTYMYTYMCLYMHIHRLNARWVTNRTHFLWHIFIRSHEPIASLFVTQSACLYGSRTHKISVSLWNTNTHLYETRTQRIFTSHELSVSLRHTNSRNQRIFMKHEHASHDELQTAHISCDIYS